MRFCYLGEYAGDVVAGTGRATCTLKDDETAIGCADARDRRARSSLKCNTLLA